jgi:hypothetical protein
VLDDEWKAITAAWNDEEAAEEQEPDEEVSQQKIEKQGINLQ